MKQATLFNAYVEPLASPEPEGERLKREGQQRAALGKVELLGIAREFAFDIQEKNAGLCDADLVAAAMERAGYPSLGNASGSLFTDGNWIWTGRFIKSARAHAHANLLRVWRWKH